MRQDDSPSEVSEVDAPLDLIAPRAAHDGLSFQELARRYNFRKTSDRRRIITRLIIDELAGRQRPVRLLDIGCGTGLGGGPEFVRAMKDAADEIWGVEPDPTIECEPGLFTRVERSMLEDAELPAEHFDVAFAFMVMEHVVDPRGFMTSLHRALKPGGAFFFVTPNGRHYFTRTARLMRALRLDEAALRLIRGGEIPEYHYPVVYRFNQPRQIAAHIEGLGFAEPEFVYLEQIGPRPYFPGPLRLIFWLMSLKRRVIRNPRCLLDLVGRIRKASDAPAARDPGNGARAGTSGQ